MHIRNWGNTSLSRSWAPNKDLDATIYITKYSIHNLLPPSPIDAAKPSNQCEWQRSQTLLVKAMMQARDKSC
jgi:hypothetical protein